MHQIPSLDGIFWLYRAGYKKYFLWYNLLVKRHGLAKNKNENYQRP
jgi:hypothetical protein